MTPIIPCPACDGTGTTYTEIGGWHAPRHYERPCDRCDGSGERGCDGFAESPTAYQVIRRPDGSSGITRSFRCSAPAEKIIGDCEGSYIDEAYCLACHRDWLESAGLAPAEAAE